MFKGTGKWFELEDLHVKEILPQTITLAESYIQVSGLRGTECHWYESNIKLFLSYQIWRLNCKKTRTERMGETEEQIKSETPWKSSKEQNGDGVKMEVENGATSSS